MTAFTNEMFSLAWSRVLENFTQLPEPLRHELEPYKPLVQDAQAAGATLRGLAAAINAITVRHIHARVVPMDLQACKGPLTLQ